MDKIEQFYEVIKKEMTVILATGDSNSLTMRVVGPVYYEGKILIFTAPSSTKYNQLKANPHCCISAGSFFAEATAEFCGATMLPENEKLRAAYCEKFAGAFDEGMEFGGRNDDFILLKPVRLTGWAFENDIPNEMGIPTVPFEISMQ